ncbi:protein phosphatase 4 regulatory subunit 1 [Tieghemostelium lacteum]|uniref:Protein phosphatase 4 regulatory subunit 1 n=1 Tax=Tieghemostelium lacteum TaxID=361077 RepID=A0A151Z420_TIELA|nr:protein phosphatase 4 regulatory subunit 1 [Tieghemostelium lacteum]|eukprot:KYQ88712.1 protein phosphatase 4 regulatory subunit 1 [Tieghemostelium lacteum]
MSDFIGFLSNQSSNEFGSQEQYPDEGVNDYVIDDSLPLLVKIQKYASSGIVLHRLYVVREFSEVIQQEFEQANAILLTIIDELVNDPEPVIRQALVEQIPQISSCFLQSGGDEGYTKILHSLLPHVARLTTDSNPQVRMSAVEALQEMAKLIKTEDQETNLIPFLKSLVNDSTDEEHRVQAANLCHNLSPILGVHLTKQSILPFVIKLASDSSFRVRKAMALNLGNICQILGTKDTTEILLPVYLQLAQDEMWIVRKGCAEVLVIVSQNISPIERYSKLINVFEQFVVEDSSRWVNNTAFQNLGPFIATFDGSQVTPKLIRYFTDMINPSSIKFPDSDLITRCAFNFPAVLMTIGQARWNELKDTYITLVSDTNWKVRRSLSHSIHEIAKILGQNETKQSLLSSFNLFLQDLDEVKVGVIKNFYDFLLCLDPGQLRESYIPIISTIVSDPNKWRFRKLIAKQLGKMCDLFSFRIVLNELAPFLILLLNDSVCKVRNYAASSVGNLILKILNYNIEQHQQQQQQLNNNSNNNNNNSNINNNTSSPSTTENETQILTEQKDQILNQIKQLGTNQAYYNRQVYIKICSYLIDQIDSSYFEANFLPTLLNLTKDPVPNVRIVIGETLSSKISKHDYFSSNEAIQNALSNLRVDNDRDVLYFSNVN